MDKKQKTLTEGDIQTEERAVGRRRALGILGAGVVGGAVVVTGALGQPQTAHAKASDSDSGPGSDPAGRGRTGHTDRDSGAGADQPGRGVCAERGTTDSDSGGGRGPCR